MALPLSSLYSTTKLLGTYLDHFQTRLGPVKASTVTSVKNVCERLSDAAPGLLQSPEATAGLGRDCHRVMLPNAFLLGCRLGNVNIPKLLADLNDGNLVFKIAGFADTVVKTVTQGGGPLLTILEKREATESPVQVWRSQNCVHMFLTVTGNAESVSWLIRLLHLRDRRVRWWQGKRGLGLISIRQPRRRAGSAAIVEGEHGLGRMSWPILVSISSGCRE